MGPLITKAVISGLVCTISSFSAYDMRLVAVFSSHYVGFEVLMACEEYGSLACNAERALHFGGPYHLHLHRVRVSQRRTQLKQVGNQR